MEKALLKAIEDVQEYVRNSHPSDKVLELKLQRVRAIVKPEDIRIPVVSMRPRMMEFVSDNRG